MMSSPEITDQRTTWDSISQGGTSYGKIAYLAATMMAEERSRWTTYRCETYWCESYGGCEAKEDVAKEALNTIVVDK